MRSTKEDIALLGEAGVWEDERDELMNACILLCMYAKRRHKPVRRLHNLAKAVEKGDNMQEVQRQYDGLVEEVTTTLRKYPDIVGTLHSMSQMSDEDIETAYRAMHGVATDEDYSELDRLGDRALSEAVSRASHVHDPERDQIFEDFVDQAGGLEGARRMVIGHVAQHGLYLSEAQADGFLDTWRRYGIVKDQSLGDFLDENAPQPGP